MFYFIDIITFFDNFVHNIHKVDDRLDNYLADPNENNIHDIRTSIRRLEAAFLASPKQMRGKKIEQFVEESKRLFKANSELRDFDIILQKVSQEGQMDELHRESFEKDIDKNRDRSLEKAISIAHILRKLDVPHINIYNSRYDFNLLQEKLMLRYNKVVLGFLLDIEKNIPVIINDSYRTEELHQVRKDSKKLRYLFELSLNEQAKGKDGIDKSNVEKDNENKVTNYNNNQDTWNKIEQLKKIQDMLGIIHDYDITIVYLKRQGKRKNFVTEINISNQRMNKYKEFVNYFISTVSNTNNKLVMSI
jgi:CHAD domain-containing protein